MVCKGSRIVSEIHVLHCPEWWDHCLFDGTRVSDVIRPHGGAVLAVARYTRCIFAETGRRCGFCTFRTSSVSDEVFERQIGEAVRIATHSSTGYSLALSDGTRETPDRGAAHLAQIVAAVKRECGEMKVSVECVPPDGNRDIERLVESGADAIIMNLEFGDDAIRRLICPGKGDVEKKRYFEALSFAASLLGRGKVSSVLIAGIEDEESTVAAARELVRRGVVPTVIPFKPYDDCDLRHLRRCDPSSLLEITSEVASLLRNAGLDPAKQPGCTSCGGCSLEKECFHVSLPPAERDVRPLDERRGDEV